MYNRNYETIKKIKVSKSLRSVLDSFDVLPNIAIIGRPRSGKSLLLEGLRKIKNTYWLGFDFIDDISLNNSTETAFLKEHISKSFKRVAFACMALNIDCLVECVPEIKNNLLVICLNADKEIENIKYYDENGVCFVADIIGGYPIKALDKFEFETHNMHTLLESESVEVD